MKIFIDSHKAYMFTHLGYGLEVLTENQLYELLWCKETADKSHCAPGFFIDKDHNRFTIDEIKNAIKDVKS